MGGLLWDGKDRFNEFEWAFAVAKETDRKGMTNMQTDRRTAAQRENGKRRKATKPEGKGKNGIQKGT